MSSSDGPGTGEPKDRRWLLRTYAGPRQPQILLRTVRRGRAPGGRVAAERLTRNWNELLQELRVAQTGVQILTGFLLTIPFTDRFGDLDRPQVTIYLAVLVGVGPDDRPDRGAGGLPPGPLPHSASGRGWSRAANVCARVGLAASWPSCRLGVILLVFDVVVGTTAGIVASALVLALFVGLWLGIPLLLRR